MEEELIFIYQTLGTILRLLNSQHRWELERDRQECLSISHKLQDRVKSLNDRILFESTH
jgi:hypothetical protein